jgi:predicted  nucleic acid-binding Zn-ribbon protein
MEALRRRHAEIYNELMNLRTKAYGLINDIRGLSCQLTKVCSRFEYDRLKWKELEWTMQLSELTFRIKEMNQALMQLESDIWGVDPKNPNRK